MQLANFANGTWTNGTEPGERLIDPVTGEELAQVSSAGVDFGEALRSSRRVGGAGLRQLSYKQRAELLGKIAAILAANRSEYFRISLLNLGANEADASFDVDGAIFTLKYYAKVGAALEDYKFLKEGSQGSLSKSGAFAAQHFLLPTKGAAIFINAFNFPAWGFCEKAAPALLSGVPIVVKPASSTAWLTHRMVEDIVKADILPPGAISIFCGSARGLLDVVDETDVISFTGSASTAQQLRSNPNVLAHSTRMNVEADSVNAAMLGPDVTPGSPLFELLAKEVVREMTLKAGQKCTAIRRVFAPNKQLKTFADALSTRLQQVKVGNPRTSGSQMGPVVNKVQQASCLEGISQLHQECETVFGGNDSFAPIDADVAKSCFVQPALLLCNNGLNARFVHDVEVFGPAATLIGYDSMDDLITMIRRGRGSLVASLFCDDADVVQRVVMETADLHGRIMAVNAAVGNQHTGHGNVMPGSLHGGPGRAGGGEELGGLRALLMYHRRVALQTSPDILSEIGKLAADTALLYS